MSSSVHSAIMPPIAPEEWAQDYGEASYPFDVIMTSINYTERCIAAGRHPGVWVKIALRREDEPRDLLLLRQMRSARHTEWLGGTREEETWASGWSEEGIPQGMIPMPGHEPRNPTRSLIPYDPAIHGLPHTQFPEKPLPYESLGSPSTDQDVYDRWLRVRASDPFLTNSVRPSYILKLHGTSDESVQEAPADNAAIEVSSDEDNKSGTLLIVGLK